LGGAYLTKATGLLFLAGAAVWCLASRPARRRLWLLVAAFIVVALPLLVRNVLVYGNPFYSYNTRFLFADSYDAGVQAGYDGLWSAAQAYAASHSVIELAARFFGGLGWELHIMLRSLGPAGLGPARTLAGLLVAALACIGLMRSEPTARLLVLVWTAISLVMFGWYVPIAAGDRFVLPLVPIWLAYAGEGAAAVLGLRAFARGRLPELLCATAAVALTAAVLGLHVQ